MIITKQDALLEMKHRLKLRKQASKKFKVFLMHVVPAFYTELKFDDYLDKLVQRLQDLIEKQYLVREMRAELSKIYVMQKNIAKLTEFFTVTEDKEVLNYYISSWTATVNERKRYIYNKLQIIAGLDDRSFIRDTSTLLSSFTVEINNVCDSAILKMTISLPPGAGKSLTTTLLSAWIIGRDPENASIMRNSFAADLAEKMSYEVRAVIESPEFRYIFPNVTLSKSRKSVKGWSVVGQREYSYFGGGPGSTISGKRARTFAMYDDFVKGINEARSMTELANTWGFYTSVHTQRMISGTAELIIGTRYVFNDLIGKVLERQARLWEQIKVPALKTIVLENGDTIEQSFCSEIKTTEEYLLNREQMPEDIWRAVAMQEPLGEEGFLYPRANIKYFTLDELEEVSHIVGYCDTADTGTDFLAGIILQGRVPFYTKEEWMQLHKEHPILHEWDKQWYVVSENGNVTVDLSSLPEEDSRITNVLRKELFSRFQAKMEYYLTDVVFSDKAIGETKPKVANMIINNNPFYFTFESNKDGKAYSKEINRLVSGKCFTTIKSKVTTGNKEARRLNNADRVMNFIHFRSDVKPNSDYQKFMDQFLSIQKTDKNVPDDAADVLSLAAEELFFKSLQFMDFISMKKEPETFASQQKELSYDEKRYEFYLNITRGKQLTVLRVDYTDNIRNYLIGLLDSINKEHKEFLKSEIARLDLKFFKKEKPLKRLN